MEKYNYILDDLKKKLDTTGSSNNNSNKKKFHYLSDQERKMFIKDIDVLIKDIKPIIDLFGDLE